MQVLERKVKKVHEMNLDPGRLENGSLGSGNLVLSPNGHASWGMNNSPARLGGASFISDVDVPFDKIGSLRLPTVVVPFLRLRVIFDHLKFAQI